MEYPMRKHPRLKEYDYVQGGYYFITINTNNNRPILSKIQKTTDEESTAGACSKPLKKYFLIGNTFSAASLAPAAVLFSAVASPRPTIWERRW